MGFKYSLLLVPDDQLDPKHPRISSGVLGPSNFADVDSLAMAGRALLGLLSATFGMPKERFETLDQFADRLAARPATEPEPEVVAVASDAVVIEDTLQFVKKDETGEQPVVTEGT